jgi:hypothetical protein
MPNDRIFLQYGFSQGALGSACITAACYWTGTGTDKVELWSGLVEVVNLHGLQWIQVYAG